MRVPAVLSGDDEREGRRKGPVRERQLPGSETWDNVVFYSHFLNFVSSRETSSLYSVSISVKWMGKDVRYSKIS